VTKEIKSDPTACEEFFLLVVKAHLLEAVKKEFKFSSLDEIPASDHETFGSKFTQAEMSEKYDVFLKEVRKVVCKYTHGFEMGKSHQENDHILAYGKEVLSLGLLYMEYNDAIREGDGIRIFRCWRFMLLLFKANNKRKYAIQAATLLLQYHFLFNERMKQQLMWSRTVNVHGKVGKNIPMDLYMEHLNRELKSACSNLGSNITESNIQRVGFCLRKLIEIKSNFDEVTNIPIDKGFHSSRSQMTDLKLILDELRKSNIFTNHKRRKHSEFPKFKENSVSKIEMDNLKSWLDTQLRKLLECTQ
jgi:L1 cell adhesion molecule like protein